MIDTALRASAYGAVDAHLDDWLVGLLEGEGSFFKNSIGRPVISLVMCDEDVVQHAAELLGARVRGYPPRHVGHKATFQFALKGPRAADAMTDLHSRMGLRRRGQISKALGLAVVPTSCPASNEDAWLAGLLEGEGYFGHQVVYGRSYPRAKLQMVDEDIVRRAADLMCGPSVYRKEYGLERGWSPTFVASLSSAKAVSLMRRMLPFMGLRRTGAIETALAAYHPERLTKAPPHCVVGTCTAAHRGRGLCHKHYMMWLRDRSSGRAQRIASLR